jgi:hypothetical protein
MNISTERLEQIEHERAQTQADPSFIAWANELNVGRMYTSPEPKIQAREMMKLWVNKNGQLNSFSVIR